MSSPQRAAEGKGDAPARVVAVDSGDRVGALFSGDLALAFRKQRVVNGSAFFSIASLPFIDGHHRGFRTRSCARARADLRVSARRGPSQQAKAADEDEELGHRCDSAVRSLTSAADILRSMRTFSRSALALGALSAASFSASIASRRAT